MRPGLHYDALAVAAFEGAPESMDTTVIPSSGARTDMVMEVRARVGGLFGPVRRSRWLVWRRLLCVADRAFDSTRTPYTGCL